VSYTPTEPYRFQSGKKEGEYAEIVMFNDPIYIFKTAEFLETKCGDNPTIVLKHLRKLIENGDSILHKINKVCKFCKNNTISHFSLCEDFHGHGISIGPQFCFCDNKLCKETVSGMTFGKTPKIISFKFSNIPNALIYSVKFDYRMIGELYKWVYGFRTRYNDKQKKICADSAYKLFFT